MARFVKLITQSKLEMENKMNKGTNYFFLSGLFLVVYLVVEFTDIYGSPGWFKAFVLILTVTFLIIGLSNRTKKE